MSEEPNPLRAHFPGSVLVAGSCAKAVALHLSRVLDAGDSIIFRHTQRMGSHRLCAAEFAGGRPIGWTHELPWNHTGYATAVMAVSRARIRIISHHGRPVWPQVTLRLGKGTMWEATW